MDLVLGIDLGTSYFKVGLFDGHGRLKGLGRVPLRAERGDGSRYELPVQSFLGTLNHGIQSACRQADASTGQIRGVSYSSQANSFLLLDSVDQPLCPLILWPDQRAATVDPAVSELWHRTDFNYVTGVGLRSNEFCVNKLRWFQQQQRRIWERVGRIMTISDYLVLLLTGERLGDSGTGSMLGLWHLQADEWWDTALDLVGLTRQQVSTLFRPGSVIGEVCSKGARVFGLPVGIPVAAGGLDHHVAAIGAGADRIAAFSASVGTVLACLRYVTCFEPVLGCCMGPAEADQRYYKLAFNENGAASLECFQREHAPGTDFDELVLRGAQVEIGSEGLIALPGARPEGRATFSHVSGCHREGHFVRAILESSAASLLSLVGLLCGDDRPKRIVATGGGARSDLWLQIMADLLSVELVTSACSEPACMGAGLMAAVAAKWYPTVEQASEAWVAIDKQFEPIAENHAAYLRWHEYYVREVERSTHD